MASHKPQRIKRTSRRQQGLEPLVGGTQGVVGSAETGSLSRGTLASLREASTSTEHIGKPEQIHMIMLLNVHNYTTNGKPV